jgi:hypothetical protein
LAHPPECGKRGRGGVTQKVHIRAFLPPTEELPYNFLSDCK